MLIVSIYLVSSIMICVLYVFFEVNVDHRDLHVLTHSFPTRRSSYLGVPPITGGEVATGATRLFVWNSTCAFAAASASDCKRCCSAWSCGVGFSADSSGAGDASSAFCGGGAGICRSSLGKRCRPSAGITCSTFGASCPPPSRPLGGRNAPPPTTPLPT